MLKVLSRYISPGRGVAGGKRFESKVPSRGKAESATAGGVLGDQSLRECFWCACRFTGKPTLAWGEAHCEIRALLVRADLEENVSSADISDAIERSDCDFSDRIDVCEFVKVVELVLGKRAQQAKKLGNVWETKFRNAADFFRTMDCRQAAGLVARLAGQMNAERKDLLDRSVLQSYFEEKCPPGSQVVSLDIFLAAASFVMFGDS